MSCRLWINYVYQSWYSPFHGRWDSKEPYIHSKEPISTQKSLYPIKRAHIHSKEPISTQRSPISTNHDTARSVEDETRNAESNGNRNSEWWGDFRQLQSQIKQKSQSEFVEQDTSEFKSNQNLNSTLYREMPRNLIFSILTSWLKSPHHSGFRLPFDLAFRVSSSTERAVRISK